MSDWFNTGIVVLDDILHSRIIKSKKELYDEIYSTYDFNGLMNCEQVSPEWLKARVHRLSGSVIANVVQIRKNEDDTFTVLPTRTPTKRGEVYKAGYDSPEKQIAYMIDPSSKYINPIYTTWGRENEHRVEECFKRWMSKRCDDFEVRHYGFVIDKDNPHMGYSPDGVVHEPGSRTDLLEFKCPYTKPQYPPLTLPNGKVARIALSHWFQVQLGMIFCIIKFFQDRLSH